MSSIASGTSSTASSVPLSGFGTITSSTGLLSGIPIQDTVSKLIALEAAPRNRLTTTNQNIQTQQTAYKTLAATLLSLEATTNTLSAKSLYNAQSLTSSSTALSATATGSVSPGTYLFTPIRPAQAQQYTSTRFASSTAAVGAGTLTVQSGGFVDGGASLDLLNNGQGITPGQLRITDRSGASTVIDLSAARNVDDVLAAINSNTQVQVTATANGNSFQLTDNTTGSGSLQVSEVNGGTTAASLGLAGISTTGSTASGSDVLKLFSGLPLSQLNGGLGVRFDNALADLKVNFSDGTSSNINFNALPVLGTQARGTTAAANGTNAQLTVTAVTAGSAYSGVSVVFQNDNSVTEGHETATYDATNKILRFNISAGHTTANDIVAAANADSTIKGLFTVTRPTGGTGTGLINVSDAAITSGPQSTATTPGLASSNAKIQFTAVQGGGNYDNVAISFVDNPAITAGNETVAYDNSNPASPQLVFQIAAGSTTAQNIINALNNDPTASQIFKAKSAAGSNGTGLVSTSDTATTAGGAIVEPTTAVRQTTLGDVLAQLNAAAPGKLQASISADGKHLQLTDLTTSNGSTFSVSDLNNSHAAEDLGLNVTASGATLTSGNLLSGLKTSLLRNLNGGQGVGQLGVLTLTDRNNQTAQVDLSQAQTVADVITLINQAGLGIQASVNSARNGIQLTDTTGLSASNLIVANGDGTNTADKLGLTTNAATTSVNSGNLHLQTVDENTTLASLNAGKGVPQGTFTITDTNGLKTKVSIGANQTTVGDVIDAINAAGIGVQAGINSTGDGILLTDTVHGGGTLSVSEGSSTAAASLHLLAGSTTSTIGGQPTQTINGTSAVTITVSATDTLQTLVTKINAAGAGVQAALFSDGSSLTPYSLQLTSQVAGSAGAVQIDTSGLGFTFKQTGAAQDALLQVSNGGSGGTLVSSPTNTFTNVLAGATLTVNSASTTPVSVTVAASDTKLAAALQTIVNTYNTIQNQLQQYTAYNTTTNTGGPLQGDPTALQVETQLASLITQVTGGSGSVQSLTDLGVTVNQDGTLTFDQSVLDAKYASDPTSIQSFLSSTTTGLSDRFKNLLENLAGSDFSVLTSRTNALDDQYSANQDKITSYNAILSSEQTRLLNAFYAQEAVIAKLQAAQQTINSLNPIAPLTGVSSLATNSNTTSSG